MRGCALGGGLSLLQDKAGEPLSGRPGCPLGDGEGSPRLCPPRLWKKVWGQVPSPQKFFQPLYMGHSGDFKVSALQPETSPSEPLTLWELTSTHALGPQPHPAGPEHPGPSQAPSPHLQSAGSNSGGAELV